MAGEEISTEEYLRRIEGFAAEARERLPEPGSIDVYEFAVFVAATQNLKRWSTELADDIWEIAEREVPKAVGKDLNATLREMGLDPGEEE